MAIPKDPVASRELARLAIASSVWQPQERLRAIDEDLDAWKKLTAAATAVLVATATAWVAFGLYV